MSFFASAENYYWQAGGAGPHYSDPGDACADGRDMGFYKKIWADEFDAVGSTANCFTSAWGGSVLIGSVIRRGDSCPQSQDFNFSTGMCGCPSGQSKDPVSGLCAIPNLCSSQKGVTKPFNRVGVAPDDLFNVSAGRPTTKSRSGCFDGCAAEMEDLRCTHKTTGAYTCKISASFSGETCGSGGTGPEETTSDAPEPQTKSETKPCVMKTNADGTQSCESSSLVDKEGKNCGTFNGDSYCSDKNANKNDIKIQTTVKTEPTADGGTKTTKIDTAIITTCTGVNSCTTSGTTITTTTTKDSSGNSTGGSSSCSGKACPDKTTNPDADGDGFGDCTKDCSDGDGEGEGEGGTAGTSGDCAVPPPCDGDIYLCSILKQSALNHCLDRAPPTVAEKEEFQQKVDAEYSKIDQLQSELDQKVTAAFGDFQSKATGSTVNGPAKCLPDYPIHFMNRTFLMEFSKLCDTLAALRFALLAVAYLAAARIVSTQI